MAERKTLSVSARNRHINSGGCDLYEIGCIYCGVKNKLDTSMEYGKLNVVENGDIHQKISCKKCGRKWIDVFKLSDVKELY